MGKILDYSILYMPGSDAINWNGNITTNSKLGHILLNLCFS